MLRRCMLVAAVAALGCGETGGDPGLPPGSSGYDNPDELMADAPPAWRPQGTPVTVGAASFIPPEGWEITLYSDGVAARSANDGGGRQCEIFVLEPRPAADGEARYQQVYDAAQALFPAGTVLTDHSGGADWMRGRWRGDSGRGFDAFGLNLSANQETVDVLPMLADFAGTAVPVVVIEPRAGSWDCIGPTGDFGLEVANVFHSLTLEGASHRSASLAEEVVGKWFSSDGVTGSLYVFGANGQYIDAGAHGGVVETSPGEWRDVYATWSGDGRYALVQDVLGMFPNDDAAQSRYVRILDWSDGQGGWSRRFCWIAAYGGSPYTHCFELQEQ